MSDATDESRDAHNKMMAAFYDWWRSGKMEIAPEDSVFGVLSEYRWIETGRRFSWDEWPSEGGRTDGTEDVLIARLTDAGCRALLEWMREAGK